MKASVGVLKYMTDTVIWLIRSVVSWKLICLFVDLSRFAALFICRCFVSFKIGRSWLVGHLVNVLLFVCRIRDLCCLIFRQSG